MDMILCMGAGISSAHGVEKADTGQKVVGVMGDSTFFHSGITGLLDIGYNKGKCTIFVLDNRSTAMTGHQEHPGTGKTLMGDPTMEASIEAFARACGIRRVCVVDPYDVENLRKTVKEELNADEASVIVTKAPCILLDQQNLKKEPLMIDQEKCRACGLCLKLSCPGLEKHPEEDGSFHVEINNVLCAGCTMCAQVCPFDAIKKSSE